MGERKPNHTWHSLEQYLIFLHREQTCNVQSPDASLAHLPHTSRSSFPPLASLPIRCIFPSRSGIISLVISLDANTLAGPPSAALGNGNVCVMFGFWICLLVAVHALQRRILTLSQCTDVYASFSLDRRQQLQTFSIVFRLE